MSSPVRTRSDVEQATVSHVITRACQRCGHPRQQGQPCAGCGNPAPPVVHRLGVQSYYHRSPLRRLAWALAGQHLAAARARRAARYTRRSASG